MVAAVAMIRAKFASSLKAVFARHAQAVRPRAYAAPPAQLRSAQQRFTGLTEALSSLTKREGYELLFAARGETLIILLASPKAPQFPLLGGLWTEPLMARVVAGVFKRLMVVRLKPDGRVGRWIDATRFLNLALAAPANFDGWAQGLPTRSAASQDVREDYREVYRRYLLALRAQPGLVDFLYQGFVSIHDQIAPGAHVGWPPFDDPAALPAKVAPQPRRRSVLLLHNSYYHYNNLALGLRRRGWDTLTVSLASPTSPAQQFYHGEDVNLWDDDYDAMREKARVFFDTVPGRFSDLHFYGKGMPSFFYDNCEQQGRPAPMPWDFMELRRHRTTIGYMASGCLDGAAQTSIRQLSGGVCGKCVWEHRSDICNDADNAFWAERLEAVCDWIGLENDWATSERTGPQYVRYPVITALDPDRWRPDLEPSEDMRIERAPGEVLVYHAVGNYVSRRIGDRDIKGTGAVMAAIEQLQAEGVPVRLFFATDVPSKIVRYLQVQADIVIDQLNYGRLGANAREALMLGRPLISSLDARQASPLKRLAYIDEAPVIPATEQSVYDVLKTLVSAPETWADIGARSRAFALKWHAADACAERFERVVDRVRAGLPAEDPALTGLGEHDPRADDAPARRDQAKA